jgi:hypothetical protein
VFSGTDDILLGIRYMMDGDERLIDDEHYTILHTSYTMSRIGLAALRALPSLSRPTSFPRIGRNVRSQIRQSTNSSQSHARQETLGAQIMRPTTIVLILVPIFTFGLGCWQIQRLRWKVGLIEEVERNMKREPMVLPAHIK